MPLAPQREARSRKLMLLVVSTGAGELLEGVDRLQRTSDWRVAHFSDGQRALAQIEREVPAMLFLRSPLSSDWHKDLLAGAANVASLFILPAVSLESRLLAFRSGADDCIEEPFDLRELAVRANVLARHWSLPRPFASDFDCDCRANASARRLPTLAQTRTAALARRYCLTPREEKILSLIADGVEMKAIGAQVGSTYSSVRTHLRRVSQKLGTSTTREILIRLFREDFS